MIHALTTWLDCKLILLSFLFLPALISRSFLYFCYPHTNIQPGDQMSSHPVFHTMLTITLALAGQKSLLPCYYKRGRWHMSLSLLAFLKAIPLDQAFHPLYITLQQFPNIAWDVKAYGIMDDVTILGKVLHLGPIYASMHLIPKDCLRMDINLTKSFLIALLYWWKHRDLFVLVYHRSSQFPVIAELSMECHCVHCRALGLDVPDDSLDRNRNYK